MSGSIGSSLSLLGPLLTQLLSPGNKSLSVADMFSAVTSDNSGNDGQDLIQALLSMAPNGFTPLSQVKIDPQPPMSLSDLVSLNPIPTSQGMSIDDTGLLDLLSGTSSVASPSSQIEELMTVLNHGSNGSFLQGENAFTPSGKLLSDLDVFMTQNHAMPSILSLRNAINQVFPSGDDGTGAMQLLTQKVVDMLRTTNTTSGIMRADEIKDVIYIQQMQDLIKQQRTPAGVGALQTMTQNVSRHLQDFRRIDPSAGESLSLDAQTPAPGSFYMSLLAQQTALLTQMMGTQPFTPMQTALQNQYNMVNQQIDQLNNIPNTGMNIPGSMSMQSMPGMAMQGPGMMGVMPGIGGQGMMGAMSGMGGMGMSRMMPMQARSPMGMQAPGYPMGMSGMMSPGMGQGMAMGGMMPPGQMGMGGMMSPASMMGQGGLTANPYFPNTISG